MRVEGLAAGSADVHEMRVYTDGCFNPSTGHRGNGISHDGPLQCSFVAKSGAERVACLELLKQA